MNNWERKVRKLKKLSEKMGKIGEGILTETGRLIDKFLPAVYIDSSVLIDYWITEGMENWTEEDYDEWKRNEPNASLIIREILKSDARLDKVSEIRRKFVFSQTKVTPVVTPLSLLELVEWNAESGFRQYASDWVGAIRIQKTGKKEVGDYIRKALDLRKSEIELLRGKRLRESTGLEIMMGDTWLNRSFAECHGLQGLLQVGIKNFNFAIGEAWQEPSAYAYLQVGIADIMHILLAKHLGCSYFASFDSDFKRVREMMKEETGVTLLSSPEEILGIL